MKRLLKWYGNGFVAVTVPFAVWYSPNSLWGAIIAGGAGGTLFLLSTATWMYRKKILSQLQTAIAVVISLMLSAGYFVETFQMRRMTVYQSENLHDARQWIGENIIRETKIYDSMMPVFREYYQQKKAHQNIVEIFRSHYKESLSGGTFNRYIPDPKIAPTWIMDPVTIVSYSGDTLVRYAVVDTFARGRINHFLNATGQKGKLEVHAALTKRGITYERVN